MHEFQVFSERKLKKKTCDNKNVCLVYIFRGNFLMGFPYLVINILQQFVKKIKKIARNFNG